MADRKKEDIGTRSISINSVLEIIELLSPDQQALIFDSLKEKIRPSMKTPAAEAVPVSIFSEHISALEAISRYLKDECNLEFKKIGNILNRNEVTIRTSYKRAVKKQPGKLDLSNYSLVVPIELFKQRKFSVLEIIVAHLHDHYKVSFKEIARLLSRNYKTVWTVYSKKKRKDAGR